MKEMKIFTTRIKLFHKLGHRKFVLGKIIGLAEGMGINTPYITNTIFYKVIKLKCTKDQYESFKNLVKQDYPRHFQEFIEFDI